MTTAQFTELSSISYMSPSPPVEEEASVEEDVVEGTAIEPTISSHGRNLAVIPGWGVSVASQALLPGKHRVWIDAEASDHLRVGRESVSGAAWSTAAWQVPADAPGRHCHPLAASLRRKGSSSGWGHRRGTRGGGEVMGPTVARAPCEEAGQDGPP